VPILDAHTLEFFSRSPEHTRRIGMRLGGMLRAGDVICLQGDLGAGKTTLVQGVAQGWGSLDPVSSPTFVLVNQYRRPGSDQLFHVDAYRIESESEAAEIDLDSMLAEGPVILEWPEQFGGMLPAERLWVKMEYVAEEQRQLRVQASGAHYDEMLADLRAAFFGAS
jgi:tRNA threonylcarbamoyladenosine biosynthesis protein TsaE